MRQSQCLVRFQCQRQRHLSIVHNRLFRDDSHHHINHLIYSLMCVCALDCQVDLTTCVVCQSTLNIIWYSVCFFPLHLIIIIAIAARFTHSICSMKLKYNYPWPAVSFIMRCSAIFNHPRVHSAHGHTHNTLLWLLVDVYIIINDHFYLYDYTIHNKYFVFSLMFRRIISL